MEVIHVLERSNAYGSGLFVTYVSGSDPGPDPFTFVFRRTT